MPKINQECLVIYSAGTSRIRRIASADDRSIEQLKQGFPCRPGEACSVFPWTSMAEVQAAVVQVTGIDVGNDRFVAVDPFTGEVDQVLRCDPECGDLVQGHTLERHDKARVGWRQMIDGSWQRSVGQITKDVSRSEKSVSSLSVLEPGENHDQDAIDALIATEEANLASLRLELAQREAPR